MRKSLVICLLYVTNLSLLCAMDDQSINDQSKEAPIKKQYLRLKNQKHNSAEIAKVVATIYFQRFPINNWTFQKDCIHPQKNDKQ